MVFVLSLLTLGIYRLFWFIDTANDMSKLNLKTKLRSVWWMLIPILTMIILFVAGFGFMIADSAARPDYCDSSSSTFRSLEVCTKTTPIQIAGTVFMGLGYLALLTYLPIMLIFFWNYAKAVEEITHGKVSFGLCLVFILLIPDGIDILVLQDYFNKIPATHTTA